MKKPAKLNYIHLCDYALASERNKVSAIGIFDHIAFSSLSNKHPVFYVVASIEMCKKDKKTHDLAITMSNPDGTELARAANIKFKTEKSQIAYFIVSFVNKTFSLIGDHKVEVYVDDVPIGSTSLDIRLKKK